MRRPPKTHSVLTLATNRAFIGILAATCVFLTACRGTKKQQPSSVENRTKTNPKIKKPGEATVRQIKGGKAKIAELVEGQKAFVGKLSLAPGMAVPEHRDPTEEYIFVLEGSGTISIDGTTYEVRKGTAIYMPAGTKVSYQNGDKPFVGLQVFAGPEAASKYDSWDEIATSSKTEPTDPSMQHRSDSSQPQNESNRRNNPTEFSLDLYRTLREDHTNLVFSPFSLVSALSLVGAGATDPAFREFSAALGLQRERSEFHSAFASKRQKLRERLQTKQISFTDANRLWRDTSTQLNDSYVETVQKHYGSVLESLDFRGAPESARSTINEWVKEQTDGMIPELLPRGLVTSETELVLTNAVYLDANWKFPFSPEDTSERSFETPDGSVDVPFMQLDQTAFEYAEVEGTHVLTLPYKEDRAEMTIFAPPAGQLGAFVSDLSPDKLEALIDQQDKRDLLLRLPKYKIRYKSPNMLSKLPGVGIKKLLEPSGLKNMGVSNPLSALVHEAVLEVDEKGTEAAAATGGMVATGLKRTVPVEIDRPFLYILREPETNTILFMGHVKDPSQ